MTAARAVQIDLKATFFYHCMTRCKRGSFLNGCDGPVGRDFSHRKRWFIRRINNLAEVFAIKICAYAVMNSHYHLILYIDTDRALSWTNLEVKMRWGKLFPRDAQRWEKNLVPNKSIEDQVMSWRERLCSISWFMRCLNEYIARSANKEDGKKGRFWQARFKSQAVLEKNTLFEVIKKDTIHQTAELAENLALCLCAEEPLPLLASKDHFLTHWEDRAGTLLTSASAIRKFRYD